MSDFDTTMSGASFEKPEIFYKAMSRFSMNTRKLYPPKAIKDYKQDGAGVPLAWNEDNKSLYLDSSDSHTLVFGATGSKKSRLIAIPTAKLLGYANESMIITDPKAEIYNRTATELKENGYDICVLNFRSPLYGSCWNPIEIPYRFYLDDDIDKAYEFVNDIATNLMLTQITEKDPFWDYSASDLFFGLTLLLFKYVKNKNESIDAVNISNLLKLRRDLFDSSNTFSLQQSELWQIAKEDEIIYASLIGTVNAPDRTQASILSTFDSKMRCFVIQPSLLDMLSNTNISLSSIGEKKTAIFLIMPDEKTSYHKLVSLFVKQSYEYIIYKAQKLSDSKMPIRINYILDEFSSLPAIKDFPAMITAARSRNIRFNLIVQSKHQLIQKYADEAETIQANCNNWIFITSRELKLLEEISTLCGTRSSGNKPLLSISALQHFNKEKGEILVLSGRLKPFKSCLPDIKKYDYDSYNVLPLCKRVTNQHVLNLTPSQKTIEHTEILKHHKENSNDSLLSSDIQKELEAKFDELFGNLDEDSN